MPPRESVLCGVSSWQLNKHLLQRVHVHAELDARLRVKAKVHGMKIDDVAHHNSLGKNAAVGARDYALPRRELCIARKITQLDNRAVQRRRTRRLDNAVLARLFDQD